MQQAHNKFNVDDMDQEFKNVIKNIENNENDFNGNNHLKLLINKFFKD